MTTFYRYDEDGQMISIEGTACENCGALCTPLLTCSENCGLSDGIGTRREELTMISTAVGFTLVTPDLLSPRIAPTPLNPYGDPGHLAPGEGIGWSEVGRGTYRSTGSLDQGDYDQWIILLSEVAGYGEYDSSAVWHRANHAWLEENYGQYLIRVGRSTHDGLSLALKVGSVVPTELVNVIRGSLDDYPVIDEDGMYSIELELQSEAMECWVLHDLRKDVRDEYETQHDGQGDPAAYEAIANVEDADLGSMFYAACEHHEAYGYAETSCSWVWDRHEWAAIVSTVLGSLTAEL